jgi:RNA polymerase sigma factor (sigma-70 family)
MDSAKRSRSDFFSRERKRLVGYVRTLIDDASDRDGEDIVQDVALGIFDKGDIAAPIENFSAYVYQALRNRVVDYFRRRKTTASLDDELPDQPGLVLADVLSDLTKDASEALTRDEVAHDLDEAIGLLDEKYRSIFVATEIEGCTFQELSVEWGVPIGTLLARKSRAMKKIKESLCEIDPGHYSSLLPTERTTHELPS